MAEMSVEINDDGWNDIVRQVVDGTCVPMMEVVAEQANRVSGLEGGGTETYTDKHGETRTREKDKAPGYEAGTEGDGRQLFKRDYRATVITATNPAMHDNAVNNTLINVFYAAEGVTE